MFADDVIIYASADNVKQLKHKLETCMYEFNHKMVFK